ncbi:DUF4011 domain-containing protein [Roseiconus nitratireducens]|nr:DUF4011 domain-containing protein [Roseiconus nitratireducens]
MTHARILDQLANARLDQLDLTARNRLISTSRSSAPSSRLEIVNERTSEVFRLLVVQRKSMTFDPRRAPSRAAPLPGNEPPSGSTPILEQPQEGEPAARHQDRRLQTDLDSGRLQSQLLRLFYDARTHQQEHGTNVLYLAAGFLKWCESDDGSDPRYAPLILIPVQLRRQNAGCRFRLECLDEEVSTNLSLQEKLRIDFQLTLPDVPDWSEGSPALAPDASPTESYFESVRRAVAGRRGWEVIPNDMVLWCYSFSKFLMYRDLDPDLWPADQPIDRHPLIQALLGDGFPSGVTLFDENDSVDRIVSPAEMFHVLDADSSQMLVIEEAKCGTNLVVQGPPGTGKSQTIANTIASAVQAGKRILFVAEKMAALEVVKRRLDEIRLGHLCLELHSHKANKREVLEDLDRTLNTRPVTVASAERQAAALAIDRDRLNRHSDAMHAPMASTGQTPFDVVGQLVRLNAQDVAANAFHLDSAVHWNSFQMQRKKQLLGVLVARLGETGPPQWHPWRGCRLDAALPSDIVALLQKVDAVELPLRKLNAAADELQRQLALSRPLTLNQAHALQEIAQRMIDAPPMDRRAVSHDVWEDDPRPTIERILDAGRIGSERWHDLRDLVTGEAWQTDVRQTRRDLKTYGRSWLRWFRSDYRRAVSTLDGLMTDTAPKALDDCLDLLDRLIEGQEALETMRRSGLAKQAFGTFFQDVDSDWDALDAISRWIDSCRRAGAGREFFGAFSRLEQVSVLEDPNRTLRSLFDPVHDGLHSLREQLQLDLKVAFGVDQIADVLLSQWLARFEQWRDEPEKISAWIRYHHEHQRICGEGLEELAEQVRSGQLAADAVVDTFDRAYHETLLREAFAEFPDLASFDGAAHEKVLDRFCRLDMERIELARRQVAAKHQTQLPQTTHSDGMDVLRHEMNKKARHLPLRNLIEAAGNEIQSIKPVFMMSPMSVARYLAPGAATFDLLLIDEASQVRPCDAIGAIARCRQMVVVGDEMQLPPTTFFQKSGVDDDLAFPQQQHVSDLESVLGLCESKNMPARMLRWHYRSHHPSLIAVSNRAFYDGRLFVVPTPSDQRRESGLQFRWVPDAIYDRGGTSVNAIEAAAVADAVMAHAGNHPDATLGVGAFSVSQRDAILQQLELRRRQHPELESFFAETGLEPFFVKNLENIQGDERDVIFISVGYGRDASGELTMNFGPLNYDGGHRRLNVLITRARKRCEVFSSIQGDDIDLARSDARGVQALKQFLTFAQRGTLESKSSQVVEFRSEFERQVAFALRERGFVVRGPIGEAGFDVDLAIVDPQNSHRYLLGIECDGRSYHSAPSARDRDRIRIQVLRERGWKLHRIWSLDWFRDPAGSLRGVLAAIDQASA